MIINLRAVTLIPHKESYELDSGQERELIGNDSIVVIKPKATLQTTPITNIVVYNPKQNGHNVSMRSVYPPFYRKLMISEKTH